MKPSSGDQQQVPHLIPYPFWVGSEEEKLRFDLCAAIACDALDAEPESGEVWAAARALFLSDLPTGCVTQGHGPRGTS